ncbi:MAG: hypothetical protein IT233_11545 [Bacteroidia bacterium]|nr:hypothetical protein [Bacteroidia bacterium]
MNRTLVAVLLLLPLLIFSQDKTETIERTKKAGVLDYQCIGNGGIVLVHAYVGKTKQGLSYTVKNVAADFSTRWIQDIKSNKANSQPKVVASSSGKMVFVMDGTEWDAIKGFSSFNLIRFNEQGDFIMKEFGSSQLYNEELVAAFCDDERFYILTATNPIQGQQYANMVIVSASDLSYQKMRLELPQKKANESKWLFAGCENGRVFLYSTKVDEKLGTASHEVAEVGPDGKVTRTFILEGSPESKKFIQAGKVLRHRKGSVGEVQEFQEKVDANTQAVSYTETVSSFGDVCYSNGKFLVSGFWSSKPSKGVKDTWEGLFVRTYDDMGRKEWNYQMAFTGKLKESKEFKADLPSALHSYDLVDNGDGTNTLQVPYGTDIFCWTLEDKGKLKTSDIKKYEEMQAAYCVFANPGAPAGLNGFAENLDPKKLKNYSLLEISSAASGCILLVEDSNENKIYLHWFNR